MQVMVIGLGYVGSVVAAGLAKAGHQVTGVDIDSAKVSSLCTGFTGTNEPGLAELASEMMRQRRLEVFHADEVKNLSQSVIIICVGTPAQFDGSVDLSQVLDSIKWITAKTVGPTTIVVKSTVPPGTGENIISDYLEKLNVKHSYVMNPEFLREGQAVRDWFHPDRTVIGSSDEIAVQQLRELYKDIEAPVLVTGVTTAEIIKYAANAFLATKISFINEIARLCEQTRGDIDTVACGIGLDKRIGPSYLQAGVGYGGSCFPKDTRALNAICSTKGINFELLQAVINVNNRQRTLVVDKLKDILGDLHGKKIAVLGLAFKPGTDDLREAPALDIIHLLRKEGAEISAYDPAVKASTVTLLGEIRCCDNAIEALEGAQGVILVTEWDEFVKMDWASVKEIMQEPYALIDGRNCLSPSQLINYGFKYMGFGRSTS